VSKAHAYNPGNAELRDFAETFLSEAQQEQPQPAPPLEPGQKKRPLFWQRPGPLLGTLALLLVPFMLWQGSRWLDVLFPGAGSAPPTSTLTPATAIALANQTPPPDETATPTSTFTPTPTPTPDCSQVEVTALRLITQTTPLTRGVGTYLITLPDNVTNAGPVPLNGTVTLSPTTGLPAGCTCKWEIRTVADPEWQLVTPQPMCNTFFRFPEDVEALELKLTIGGQQPDIEETFVIYRGR
jgi:hypothetical protein